MADVETDAPAGRTHITPSPGDSVGYWLRIVSGTIGIVTVIVAVTAFILGQGTKLSVLESHVEAQDVQINRNTQTIDRVISLLTDIKLDVAAIKGALGIKDRN